MVLILIIPLIGWLCGLYFIGKGIIKWFYEN